MERLKEFIIPFIGLKDGSHEYRFEVNSAFFEAFPYSEIREGKLDVEVQMVKRPQMLTFDIQLSGTVKLTCDRCGNEYDQPLSGKFSLVVNLNADTFNDEDDLVSLPAGAHEIDLSKYIYEYISLMLPPRRVCVEKPDASPGCDPEIIRKLEELSPG